VGSDLSVFHVIGDVDPRSGGTARAVVDVTDALAQETGVAVTLLFQMHPGQNCLDSIPLVRRIEAMSRTRWASASGLPLKRALGREIARAAPSLIHVHGLWMALDHWAVAAARRHGIPLVIQPHGMLEPWALRHHAWKKRIAMSLYQRRDLEAADLLIASTAREAESLRCLGFKRPIAIIPHGIRPVAEKPADRSSDPAGPHRLHTVLFLSRLHPVKGLPNLIKAWARLAPQGWRLVIAGPDQGGHLQEIQALIRRHGLGETVQYVGEVRDEVKSALYRAADLFVLPTHTENFGIVVAEALAHGVPVITTRGAPWAELETHRCGWWIDIGEEPLVKALQEAMAMSDEVRHEMGARGREFAQRYEWSDVARQLHAAYRWVLGRGARPDCVRVD
jgi:glycosyltransferase involved in cell wall biosynthesis